MTTSRRESALTKSIQNGVLRDPDRFRTSCGARVMAFFTIRRIKLVRFEGHLFTGLRREVWNFNEDEYQASFHTSSGQQPLKAIGDLGYSGSVSTNTSHNFETYLPCICSSTMARHFSVPSTDASSLRVSLDDSSIHFSKQIYSSPIMNICGNTQIQHLYG